MFYVDTSVLVAALVVEARSIPALEWLHAQTTGTLHTSDWTMAEFSSALSVKMRTGQIGAEQRAAATTAFSALIEQSFDVLPIFRHHFLQAARFSDRHELSIKAGDALHMAVAVDNRLMLCTLDRRFAAAGPELGTMTKLL